MSQNAEPNATCRRCRRIAVGVIAIAALACLLVWSLAQHYPRPPRTAPKSETPSILTNISFGMNIDAEKFVEVPFGDTTVLTGLGRGYKYDIEASPYLQEDAAAWSEAERREWMESEYWDYELPPFEATVLSAHIVSEDAFAQWYPAWVEGDEGLYHYADEDVRFLVAEVRVRNTGEFAIRPEQPVLRSPLFKGESDKLNFGMPTNDHALAAIYPLMVEYEGDIVPALDATFDDLEPGEERVIAYPYIIYRNSFTRADAIDSLQLSDFSLAYFDYHPWTIIELKLG